MSRSVLVVEDDALNLRFFTELLSWQGYRVRAARTGAGALAAAQDERPDLVLLDIELPDESGLSVAGALRADAALSDVPVVAVTAFARAGEEARLREGGCSAYVSKPVNMRGFLDVVRKFAQN